MRPLIRGNYHLQLMRESKVLLEPLFERFMERSLARFIQLLPSTDRAEYSKFAILHRDWLAAFDIAVRDADRPERLFSLLGAFAQTHLVSQRYRPSHLAILTNCLLSAAGEVLSNEWTTEIEAAWDEALHSMLVITIKAAARAPITR